MENGTLGGNGLNTRRIGGENTNTEHISLALYPHYYFPYFLSATTMADYNDNGLKSAMDDDDLVAQVLLTLRQPSPPPSKLRWSIRQRRSRPQPAALIPSSAVKKSPAARASPTTPLSWSGGGATSVSGGGNGNECSRLIQNRSDESRSKGCVCLWSLLFTCFCCCFNGGGGGGFFSFGSRVDDGGDNYLMMVVVFPHLVLIWLMMVVIIIL